MADRAAIARHTSVQSAAMTTFFRPVFWTASTTRLSSQEFIVVRSMGVCSGYTAWIVGKIGPLKVFEATVVRMVGTLKIFAALTKPVTLLMSNCVSMDCAAKAICG